MDDKVVTIQLTSKKYKAWLVISAALFVCGLVFSGVVTDLAGDVVGSAFFAATVIGAPIWHLATRVLIWWHHR